MPLTTDDFDFDLPEELIASVPIEPRDASRLLVVDRASGLVSHKQMTDIVNYRQEGDVWVFNDSRVIPARLITHEGLEILLTRKTAPAHWCALMNNKKKSTPGAILHVLPKSPNSTMLRAEVLKSLQSGEKVLRFERDFEPELYGRMPLPPYILKRRAHLSPGELEVLERKDEERYQTTYAAKAGSVAAPTAGLHFTPQIMAKLPHVFITLHVGIGTFRPVKTKLIQDHNMHGEHYWIPQETADALQRCKRRVAVGTTTVRALESISELKAHGGTTHIFIYPPYKFRHCDALFTNFHLPKSTLLMLVAAFLANPPPNSKRQPLKEQEAVDWLKEIYAEAVRERYRFFSYGDAMLIL